MSRQWDTGIAVQKAATRSGSGPTPSLAPLRQSRESPRCGQSQRMVAKSESPVHIQVVNIPVFTGFQHVSTIQGDAGFLPSSVCDSLLQSNSGLVVSSCYTSQHVLFQCRRMLSTFFSHRLPAAVDESNWSDMFQLEAPKLMVTHVSDIPPQSNCAVFKTPVAE